MFWDWQVFVDLTKLSRLSSLPKAHLWGPEVQGSPHLGLRLRFFWGRPSY